MERNGLGQRFVNHLEQTLKNQNLNYDLDEMEDKVHIFLPTKTARSTITGFNLYISEYSIQVIIFDIVRDIEKNEKYLAVLNEVNMEHSFLKFIINDNKSVVGTYDFLHEGLDVDSFIEFLVNSLNSIDFVFDSFMKARYS